MMRNIIIVTLIGLFILLLFSFYTLKYSRIFGAIMKENNSYIVNNAEGDKICCRVYPNFLSNSGERVQQLIVFFPENVENKFITIAIPEKLIGLPNYGHGYNIFWKYIYMSNSALTFNPINSGFESFLSDYLIENGKIEFETFDNFKKYGERIIIQIIN